MDIRKNISLAQYTTFKIGGPAKFFCEAKNEEEILEAIKFAREKKIAVFILGGGSNILVSDKGFDGLVIKILNSQFSILNYSINCGAGCPLSKIVKESIKAGLTGLEWAAGIPGTVGGAVRGNAGCFGGEMADIIESVKVLEIPNFSKARPLIQGSTFPFWRTSRRNYSRSNLWEIPQSRTFRLRDCKFAYRDSIFKQNPNLIILSATLKFKKSDKKESEEIVRENLEKRKKLQPAVPCPGSFFKNPRLRQGFGGQAVVKNKDIIRQFERDTGQKIKDGIIPAGYLIERTSLKGKKIGGVMVSREHANFIVNAGGATAEDVIMLAAIVKTRVRNKFGIQLREEIQYVGF